MEFFRTARALVDDAAPSLRSILISSPDGKAKPRQFCSCSRGKTPNCIHAAKLSALCPPAATPDAGPEALFKASVFHRVFDPIAHEDPRQIRAEDISLSGNTLRCIPLSGGSQRIQYVSAGEDLPLFESRLRGLRSLLITELVEWTLSTAEKDFAALGRQTQGLAKDMSIWLRLAYHCFREFSADAVTWDARIDPATGELLLGLSVPARELVIDLRINAKAAIPVLDALKKAVPAASIPQWIEAVHEVFFVMAVENDLVTIKAVLSSGAAFDSAVADPVGLPTVYGSLVYRARDGALVRISPESSTSLSRAGLWSKPLSADACAKLFADETALFSLPSEADDGALSLFSSGGGDDLSRIAGLPVLSAFSGVSVEPIAEEGDICTLAVRYTAGPVSVALADLMEARSEKRRFCISDQAVVDLQAAAVARVLTVMGRMAAGGAVSLHRAYILQFAADAELAVTVAGRGDDADRIRAYIAQKPRTPLLPITGLKAELRHYQSLGIDWLLFLYDYRLGGLLCDDMGLGKTLQILSLIAAIRQQRQGNLPSLVVCPATVVDHWRANAERFLPFLRVHMHVGSGRSLGEDCLDADIVVTSYGVLRNDIAELAGIHFAVAVFDEAQNLKNRDSKAAIAAAMVLADARYCLSGTPVENSINDLKSLFDIVLPGYLGDAETFRASFVDPVEERGDDAAAARLRALVRPFVLRRLKKAVLTELPEKIEDTRYCGLSDMQERQYRELQALQAAKVVKDLADEDVKIDYMHVFALLNRLRQICCHPLLGEKGAKPPRYDGAPCAKWDLFTELMTEVLAAGHKVVVFSHFVDMVGMMAQWCADNGIGAVTITGQTRDRATVIKRFNSDESCRVFAGTPKAGGVGIDLTAADVVIHYDRWWNAAREDQATDRVYRMGQTRGVQVIRLVTEDSIEEYMAGIIAAKRRLIDLSLDEDEPDAVQVLSREDLLKLLSVRG